MSSSCQAEAKSVATCLTKSPSSASSACTSQLDALYACCNTFYAEQGERAENASCPGMTRLKLKVKQRKMGKDSVCGFERGLKAD